ncbi:MAG TPA: three-Cys-motif partner protein TcmP [Stellaceae bacterium]|nr:three-Cys-motif partner protein TcmP [Stellaceae bacterium]
MSVEHAQKFGGPWSLLKVEAVEKYLHAYATAMSKQSFKLVYIDAFAGSGLFTFGEEMPLIAEDEAARVFAGSVKRALAIDDELFFLEADERNVASLRAIAGADTRVEIIPGDANSNLVELCQRLDWKGRRGVVFVDPCGPETDWAMLRAIAATKALDVFWLFPLSAVYRNAPRDHGMLTPEKRATVSKCLGCTDWEDSFYSASEAVVQDLFGDTSPKVRHVDIGQIERFVMQKLKNIFPHVERPARLLGHTKAPLFNLFFAMANPSPKAKKVASPIARYLLDGMT